VAVSPWRRLARGAPVEVFAAAGMGAGLAHVELASVPDLRLVASPRHATVLVAVGRFPGPLGAALARLHDQLPHPRAAVWVRPAGVVEAPAALDGADLAQTVAHASASAVAVGRALRDGAPSRPDVLPDAPPHPFEGLGDHRQGGEGMMGGVPWGRPMAMTGPDRDGLSLDRSEVRMGPFLVGMPEGVTVDAVLQGGVVQEASVVDLDDGEGSGGSPTSLRRHRLRWLTETCRLAGLDALAARAATVAVAPVDADHSDRDGAALVRAVRRSGLVTTWRDLGDGGAAAARLDEVLGRLESSAADEPVAPARRPSLGELGHHVLGLTWSDALVVLHSLDPSAIALEADA